MISSVGLVPPLVLPIPGQYAEVAQATTVAAAADPMAVEVTVPADAVQTLPDGTVLMLNSIVAPHASKVRYLPAGDLLVEPTWPVVVGPFARDAWVIDALADVSAIAALLPPTVPAPVYWVLEGVEPTSVDDPAAPGWVLDSWLDGAVPGVRPKVRQCHRWVTPAERADTPEHTWKQAMLAGRWSEAVPAETVLGLVTTDGTSAPLRIWTYGADGTTLPAAAILDAFAAADPALLPAHPVVAGCHTLLADPALPVQFYLRFDLWDVTGSSPADPKGLARSLQPVTVRLVDTTSGTDIPGTNWTWLEGTGGRTGGVLEVARGDVSGADFTVRPEFPAGLQVSLSRTDPTRSQPVPPGWSTAGWTAQDGVTPGSWAAFNGVLIGTQTQPVVFSVGTKVRLSAGYQQQRRDWFAQSPVRKLDTRRLAGGHSVRLYQGGPNPADEFLTDDDGEVSGVSFTVLPGTPVTVGLPRQLDVPAVNGGNATTLVALDSPVGSVFPHNEFQGTDALVPVTFPAFSTGTIGPADLVIDADAAGGKHTADAAAFHALKYARFATDATVLLKTDSVAMPVRHEFVIKPGSTAIPSTQAWPAGNPASTDPDHTVTDFGSEKAWFYPNVVIHEYAHGLVSWLGGELTSIANFNVINNGNVAIADRLANEYGHGHNAWLVTNSGTGLDEGLPEFFEFLFGYRDSFVNRMTGLHPGSTTSPPPGQKSWPQHKYQVIDHAGTAYVQLSADMGRRVEGVFAIALWDYLANATTFPGFLVVQGDSTLGARPAHACLHDWAATAPAGKPDQLGRLFRWLITDAIGGLYGSPATWTGAWTGKPGLPYPTVRDFLSQLQASDPAGAAVPPTPEESFQHLFDTGLQPWNLEQFDPAEPKPPVLAPDWLP
jgi:hypothetical protein